MLRHSQQCTKILQSGERRLSEVSSNRPPHGKYNVPRCRSQGLELCVAVNMFAHPPLRTRSMTSVLCYTYVLNVILFAILFRHTPTRGSCIVYFYVFYLDNRFFVSEDAHPLSVSSHRIPLGFLSICLTFLFVAKAHCIHTRTFTSRPFPVLDGAELWLTRPRFSKLGLRYYIILDNLVAQIF